MSSKKSPNDYLGDLQGLLNLLNEEISSLLLEYIITQIPKKEKYFKKYSSSDFNIPRKELKWEPVNIDEIRAQIPDREYKWKKYDSSDFDVELDTLEKYPHIKTPELYVVGSETLMSHITTLSDDDYEIYYKTVMEFLYQNKTKPYILVNQEVGLDRFISMMWEESFEYHNGNLFRAGTVIRDLVSSSIYQMTLMYKSEALGEDIDSFSRRVR